MTAYRNEGGLFDDTNLSQIATYPEWTLPEIEEIRRSLEELVEKKDALFEEHDNNLDRKKTAYYWTSHVLRRLQFCHSVVERAPGDEDMRPEFTLFYGSEDFSAARNYRGTRNFFSEALSVMRTVAWDDSLDGDGGVNPAYELDRYMRQTGVSWGVLTNGHVWRLYHRDTSGLLTTYYEVDMLAALESSELDDFKYFYLVFSRTGLGGATRGQSIVDRLYD